MEEPCAHFTIKDLMWQETECAFDRSLLTTRQEHNRISEECYRGVDTKSQF